MEKTACWHDEKNVSMSENRDRYPKKGKKKIRGEKQGGRWGDWSKGMYECAKETNSQGGGGQTS